MKKTKADETIQPNLDRSSTSPFEDLSFLIGNMKALIAHLIRIVPLAESEEQGAEIMDAIKETELGVQGAYNVMFPETSEVDKNYKWHCSAKHSITIKALIEELSGIYLRKGWLEEYQAILNLGIAFDSVYRMCVGYYMGFPKEKHSSFMNCRECLNEHHERFAKQ